MPLFSFEGRSPKVHPSAFVAPTAVLVGDVTVEENASVWYNADAFSSTVTSPTSTAVGRSEEHTSELQSQSNLVCRLLLEKKIQDGTSVRSSFTRHALSSQRRSAPGSLASTVTRLPRPTRSASLSFLQMPSHSAHPSAADA